MEDKLMDNHGKEYTLLVRGKRVSVTKEVYKAYYCCRDREKYLDKLAEDNNISLEGCYERGISVEYIISSTEDSMEDTIITGMLLVKLRQCLKMLDDSEKMLIVELYLRGKSERQLSKETGIPPMTLHDRKRKILNKLKNLMEK
jgi:RNA polymerase sigma factor (sigma-70 family)